MMRRMSFGNFLKVHKVAILIFFFAIIVRLALFFMYLDFNQGDFVATIWGADGYSDIGKNLAQGNGYSESSAPPYVPNSLRPPAWIFIIALFTKVFASYVPIFVFQLVLSGLIPILGMYLAGRIISANYAPIIGILLALEPAAVFSTTMLASETSFTFFFLVFVIFLFNYIDNQTTRNIVWSAVFLGLAILVKPTVQFLPILIPLGLVFVFRKSLSLNFLKHAVYFIVVTMLVLAPWIFRNHKEFGTYGLTSQPAYNLYTVLVPTVISIDTGTNYESEQKVYSDILRARGDDITLTNSKQYIDESVSILSQHKTAFLKSLGISVVTFFTHDHMLTVLGYGGVTIPNLLSKPALVLLFTDPVLLARDIFAYASTPGIFVLLGRLFWIAVTFLFFCGSWLYFRREKFSPIALAAFLMVAYFALLTAANGFGMNGRFRIPVNVFIFTFAVYGFVALRGFVTSKLLSYRA
jgi:hypothetical protein